MKMERLTAALLVFAGMSAFNILDYWQVYNIKPDLMSLVRYAVLSSPLQILAYIGLVLGITWTYRAVGGSIWVAVATVALASAVSKILPIYLLSGKLPVKGEIATIILLILSVLIGAIWK